MNKLYTKNNLTVLSAMPSQSVDLIYLDPPFNSKRNYQAPAGSQADGVSFSDIWGWGDVDESAFENLIGERPCLAEFIRSMQGVHGKPMMAYLAYMAIRLVEIHRVLKPTGSLYLHCDPKASHLLKLVLDWIFGEGNFLNEIIWSYKTGGVSKHWFGRKHDVILFYTKSDKKSHTFNISKERSFNRGFKPYRFKGVEEFKDAEGRWYTMAALRDVWEINPVGRTAKERTGYPTQKPLALLERIIKASSSKGDVVLDPFCGSGTTLMAAQKLGRQWIGIDAEPKVAQVLTARLTDAGLESDFTTTL